MDTELLKTVHKKYREITLTLIAQGKTIATMESCTAGLVASLITDTEGSSAVLSASFITYANEAKVAQGVSIKTIDTYGVYSAETAHAMALAVMERLGVDIAVGVTGTMGNIDPNNSDSIVDNVYFALAEKRQEEGVKVHQTHLTLTPQANRFCYKLVVANSIADKLIELLSVVS